MAFLVEMILDWSALKITLLIVSTSRSHGVYQAMIDKQKSDAEVKNETWSGAALMLTDRRTILENKNIMGLCLND